MYATHDYAEISRMADPDCVFCESIIEIDKDDRRLGLTIVGLDIQLGDYVHDDIWSDGRHIFIVEQQITLPPWKEYDRDGQMVVNRESAEQQIYVYNLYYQDGAWFVWAVKVKSEKKKASGTDE